MTTLFTNHFIRILPITGETLQRKRVALLGIINAIPIVEHLAACGVGNWAIGTTGLPADQLAVGQLRSHLQAQHGQALALDLGLRPMPVWLAALRDDPPDLLIVVGDQPGGALALRAANDAGTPALICMPPRPDAACWADVVFAGQDSECLVAQQGEAPPISAWEWCSAVPLLGGIARALLLRNSSYARPDLEALWSRGQQRVTIGAGHALDVMWTSREAPIGPYTARFQTPLARRGALLIAGLGSIGSVAAALLAPWVNQLVLADPDSVDPANPARQHYRLADLGRPKVQALQESLAVQGLRCVALPLALIDEQQVDQIVRQHGITAALVATGTNADFAIARALRDCAVPHVVCRCYSRARYWEAVLVDGMHGPAFDDIRGHLRYGPAPAPTAEQLAAYSDAGALESEPATLLESGWAAAWAARLAWQLLAPAGLRERWLLELLEDQQTCLVGGAYVEQTSAGPAYAIDIPGRIHAWGTRQIAGAV